MWKSICITLWISFGAVWAGWAQNYAQSKAFAQAAMARGDYPTALYTYKRLAFFKQEAAAPALYFQMAQCYQQMGQFQQATHFYNQCYFKATDSLAQQALFSELALLLRQNKFKEALAEIEAMEFSLVTVDTSRKFFFKGLAHFGRQEFDAAQAAFCRVIPPQDTLARQHLEQLLLRNKSLHTPNPNLARTLSFTGPGLGQFYLGDFKNGLNSLALNAGLVALAVHMAGVYTWFDAVIAVVPWWQRYYLGGAQKAAQLAQTKRLKNQRTVYLQVLTVIRASTQAQ